MFMGQIVRFAVDGLKTLNICPVSPCVSDLLGPDNARGMDLSEL